MSSDEPKLSKRRLKSVQLKVEWEADATNPLGITSPLMQCRDLLSLATNSVDIFNDVLGNVESLSKIHTNFRNFARRVLDAGMCAWLFVLLYAGPHDNTVKLLEELVGAFAAGRALPKGFSIRSPRGKAFLPPEEYGLVLKACRESVRLLFVLSGQLIKSPLESRDPIWLLGIKLLQDDDVNQSALACNSLLYEIEQNPRRLLLFQELKSFLSAFRNRILSFEGCYKELKRREELLMTKNTDLQRSRRKFKNLLKEIANVENEELLDVPLDHYLKEHDNLRIAHDTRQKNQKLKDRADVEFQDHKGVFDVLFSCIRCLGLLVSRGVAMYTGLNIDTTSLLPVTPDTVVPTTVESSAMLYPILYGGNSTSGDNNKDQKDSVVSLLIHEIPWKTLASLVDLERSVSGTLSLRLVVAVAAKLSDTLQSRLGLWSRRALHDLVQMPRWYPVEEGDSVPEATKVKDDDYNPNMVQGLLSILEDESVVQPKWRYFKRELSLDCRISTALVYWCNRGNKSMARRTLSWTEVVRGVKQHNLLWQLLIQRASTKCEIIENVDEFYAKTNPRKLMQEMSKMTLAKSMNELDPDGDSDSDDDSDNESEICSVDSSCEDASQQSSEDSQLEDEKDEFLRYTCGEDEDQLSDVVVDSPHSAVMENLFNDEFALAILHCSATEIPNLDIPAFDLYKDAKMLSIGCWDCARYIHNELYDHMRKILAATLEGPADDSSQRFNHPLHIVSMLVQHDDKDNLVAPALCGLDASYIKLMIEQCTHIRRGVCDIAQQRVAIELLISALGGPKPTFMYPVFAPDHQHTVANRNAFRHRRSKAESDLYPELRFYHEMLHSCPLHDCLSELVIRLYDSHRSDFTPMGPSGRCHIALILRLLTVIADIDCNIVIKHLRAACKIRAEQGDKFWASSVALSKDLLWLAPFIISFELGTFQVIGMHRRTALWKEKVINEETYGNSVYRCDIDIIRNYSCLLSVLCTSSPTLCSKIGENSTSVALAFLDALSLKDRFVSQFIFRSATAIVHHAKVFPANEKNNKSVSKFVPFDDPATNFRTLFIQEGNALDIGCELLLDTYYDIWHKDVPVDFNKKTQNDNEEVVVPGKTVPMKKKVAKMRDMMNNSRESSGELQEESSYDDKAFPLLAEFNSSYHVETIAEENSQLEMENSTDEIIAPSQNDEKLLNEGTNISLEKSQDNVVNNQAKDDLDKKVLASSKSEDLEGISSSMLDSTLLPAPPQGESHNNSEVLTCEPTILVSSVEDTSNQFKSVDDSYEPQSEQSGKSQANDSESEVKSVGDDDVSNLDLHFVNEWDINTKDDRCYGAKCFALYTLECIIEMVENRLELQDRIYDKSRGIFKCLYNLLTPKTREDFDLMASSMVSGGIESRPDDGTQTLTAVHAHMGLIGATAESIRVVVRRHPKIRELVRDTGCIEGLMDALDMSYSIDDKVLGIFVVTAVEQLIVRNIEAWNFVKRSAGMKGLLQLCHMGNNAVRILSATEIISQITPKHDPKIYAITEEVLNNNGLGTILRMLKCPDELVQSASLSLLQALCINKLACRHAVMMPEFIAELGTLLFSSSLSVVRVACEVMSVLGAEDQFTLLNLVRNMESHMLQPDMNMTYSRKKHCSITGRLMDIANGVISTNSCDDVVFEDTKSKPETSTVKSHSYISERLPPLFNSEPRLKQEIVTLSNKAAGVLAAITDTEESNWPDGGAPLRNTLSKSGILPTIKGKRRTSDGIMASK